MIGWSVSQLLGCIEKASRLYKLAFDFAYGKSKKADTLL